MTPFEAYCDFLAIKRHFQNENYDYFRYNGKLKLTNESFESRKDKFYFYKLSKKKHAKELILANMLKDTSIWVGDLVQEKACDDEYLKWKQRQESMTYNYQKDLDELDDEFDKNLVVENGEYPILLKKYFHGKVSIDTMVVLNKLVNYIPKWTKEINDTVIWPNERLKILKYEPFVKMDIFKLKKITINRFAQDK